MPNSVDIAETVVQTELMENGKPLTLRWSVWGQLLHCGTCSVCILAGLTPVIICDARALNKERMEANISTILIALKQMSNKW